MEEHLKIWQVNEYPTNNYTKAIDLSQDCLGKAGWRVTKIMLLIFLEIKIKISSLSTHS